MNENTWNYTLHTSLAIYFSLFTRLGAHLSTAITLLSSSFSVCVTSFTGVVYKFHFLLLHFITAPIENQLLVGNTVLYLSERKYLSGLSRASL